MKRTRLAFVGAALGLLLFSGHWNVLGQMGGMGGGGMGGGGAIVPSERDKILDEMTKKPRLWSKPKGPSPGWLKSGRTYLTSVERVRSQLSQRMEPNDIPGLPLNQVLTRLSAELNIPIHVDYKAVNEAGIMEEEPITLQTTGSARNILRLVLDPLGLTYIVREGCIEVTTVDKANENPTLGFYDLSFIVPDSGNLKAIVLAIEQSIEPSQWTPQGGFSQITVVENLLVVSATEKAHTGIEALLARLAPADAEELGNTERGGDDGGNSNQKRDQLKALPEKGKSTLPEIENDPFGGPNKPAKGSGGPGIGLRMVIPALGPVPLAFDFAPPVARTNTDD